MAEGIWMLPTRHRPGACAALIAAMQATGDVPKLAVMIDDDPTAYERLVWPDHWDVHVAPRHLEVTRAVNLLVELYPGRKFYGLIGDHCRPMTPGWSGKLASAAGDWNMAYCRDNWLNGRRADDPSRRHFTGAMVLGGRLIAALGWALLPSTIHQWGDDALELIGERLDLLRYLDDVVLESHRYHNGRAPADANHRRIFEGVHFPSRDKAAFDLWRAAEADAVVAGIRAAIAETT